MRCESMAATRNELVFLFCVYVFSYLTACVVALRSDVYRLVTHLLTRVVGDWVKVAEGRVISMLVDFYLGFGLVIRYFSCLKYQKLIQADTEDGAPRAKLLPVFVSVFLTFCIMSVACLLSAFVPETYIYGHVLLCVLFVLVFTIVQIFSMSDGFLMLCYEGCFNVHMIYKCAAVARTAPPALAESPAACELSLSDPEPSTQFYILGLCILALFIQVIPRFLEERSRPDKPLSYGKCGANTSGTTDGSNVGGRTTKFSVPVVTGNVGVNVSGITDDKAQTAITIRAG